MSNENHRYHHHQFQHQKLRIQERTTFLPMLCSRPSIKDASLRRWRDLPASVSDDPLSPRIGCMGQVKRNNKIVGLPSPHRLTNTSISPAAFGKYSKLKRLFSGKSLNANRAPVAAASTTCGRKFRVSDTERFRNENEASVALSFENMDPPLPVIKRVQRKSEGESQADNLWKRRSGSVALKSLQLQQIHHPRQNLQPTSV